MASSIVWLGQHRRGQGGVDFWRFCLSPKGFVVIYQYGLLYQIAYSAMERIHSLQGLVSRRILLWKHARRLKSGIHHHHCRHEEKRHVWFSSSSSQHGRHNQTKWLNNNNNVSSIINGRSCCETHLLPDCSDQIGQKASCLYPATGDLSPKNEKIGLVEVAAEKREGQRRHFLADQININNNNYFYTSIGKNLFSTVSLHFIFYSFLPTFSFL